MSTLTINLTYAGEVPASVSLLTLTDASTGADVSTAAGLTLPSAFTLAGGSWSRTFTDIGAAVYAYTYRTTWSDATYDDGAGVTRGTSLFYSTDSGVNALLGPDNASVDADINSDGNATTARAERDAAHAEAKTKIDSMLAIEAVTIPLTSSPLYAQIQYAANRYSAVALTRMRGQLNQQGKPVEAYKVYLTEADTMMERLIALLKYGGNVVSAPVAESNTYYPTCRATWGPVYGW